MRLPVPRSRLVTLTLLASVLTLAVTVGLAYPSLLPGTTPSQDADAIVLADGDPPVITAEQSGAAVATSGSTATPSTPAAVDAASTPKAPPSATALPPTPNPNFTPAVQTATGSSRGWFEHEDDEHEGEHEDEEDDHEWEDEDEWEDD